MNGRSKLLELPKPIYQSKEPKYLLKWPETSPILRRFIYIHLIRAIGEYKGSRLKLTHEKLVQTLSENMGHIVKRQVELYIENLLFYGFLSEGHENRTIQLTDKLYQDLLEAEKDINLKKSHEVER